MAYDNPIPGFQTNNTINLRLWAAKPDREFDLQAFNTGDYVQARLSTSAGPILDAGCPASAGYRAASLHTCCSISWEASDRLMPVLRRVGVGIARAVVWPFT